MKTLDELKSENIPCATMESIGAVINPKTDSPDHIRVCEKNRAAMTEYLSNFVSLEGQKCPKCGLALLGLFTGKFTWGLAHGEGYCSHWECDDDGEKVHCGYPVRMYHKIEPEGDDEVGLSLTYPLPYHPSVLHNANEEVEEVAP